jgi:hypothetical protein
MGTMNSPRNVGNKIQNVADLHPSRAKALDIINTEVICPAEANFKSLCGNSKTLKDSTFKILKEKAMLRI